MKLCRLAIGLGVIALATACSKDNRDNLGDNALIEQPSEDDRSTADPNAVPAPPPAATSPEAARQVMRDYGALIARGSRAEAAKYWSDPANAKEFAAGLEDYPQVTVAAGMPKDEEGAAGSIFITVPLTLNLTLRNGSPFKMQCDGLMRRVNDVPGSSEEQRRWRIESIDC